MNMIRHTRKLERMFGTFYPPTVTEFPKSEKILIYSNDSRENSKLYFYAGIIAQFSLISYYNLIYPSIVSLIGLGGLSVTIATKYYLAKIIVEELNLLKDGKTIEIKTARMSEKNRYHIIKISEIEAVKFFFGYQVNILSENKSKSSTFCLDKEGVVLNEDLYFAILRGLDIDNSQFVNQS